MQVENVHWQCLHLHLIQVAQAHTYDDRNKRSTLIQDSIRYGNETCTDMGVVLGPGMRHYALTWGGRMRHIHLWK